MEQIKKTKDYDKFQILTGNRSIDKYALKKLKASIEKSNHLNIHPIIVNNKFEVIDGQHRLQAARELDIEIFYIKSDKVEDDHLIDSNVAQKSWEVDNFIDYFAIKEKKTEYIILRRMMKDSGLKPKALLTLILGVVSTNILEFLKTGKFKFPQSQDPEVVLLFYFEFKQYATDKRLKPLSMFSNHNFTRALRWIFLTEGFQSSIFFKKLDLRWFDLKPQRTSEDWYKLLVDIYNFKNHNRIENEYGTKV